ncbi:MAG: hypothetical protein QHH26_01640 [Armatimonadota bacterium]|nr:hypothetical protein [Armatimonadota bacterium]
MMGDSSKNRRGFILKGLLALLGGLIGRRVLAEENSSGLETEGEVLKTCVYKGRPPIEPLDTMVRFERSDNNNKRAMTHEILSLMHEEKGTKSYPWTIYSHLTTHHVEGDACVICSRLHKNGRGWSCGLHSEVFSNAPMVGLGVNVEMSNLYAGSEQTVLYGVNVMACGPNPCQSGIVIKNNGSGPGAIFEKQISLESGGSIGIDLPAKFDVGIQMHGNAIALDGEGKIKLRYSNGRIEFLNGDKCIGHINVEEEDHEL